MVRNDGDFPVDDWTPLDDAMPFDEGTPLQRDVLLKGSLLVVVTDREGSPRAGVKVTIRGCGSVSLLVMAIAPALDVVRFTSGLDAALVSDAEHHGWRLLFPKRHPYVAYLA